jgi:AcrR family transcriptional regulator
LLEREQIVKAGLELTRRHGLDGMSMRKLGQELGVTSMAIYWCFKGRDELVEAITDSVLAEIELPADDDAPWDERLRRFAWAVHDVLVDYPGIGDELLTHQNYPPSAVRLVEYSVAVLREAGFDDLRASTAFNVLSGWVVARSHFEAYQRLVSVRSDGSTVAERARAGWQRLGQTVGEAPHTATYVRHIGELDDPATIFDHGVELLLRGLKDELRN